MRTPTQAELVRLAGVNPFSEEVEQALRPLIPASERATLGQVFTPWPIAQFMAAWVAAVKPQTVLDPAAGASIFARALRHVSDAPTALTLADLDPNMLKVTTALAPSLTPFSVTTSLGDFLLGDWSKYDGIIANPPYVKHSLLGSAKDLYQAAVEEHVGVRLPASSNLYCWFYVKALAQLGAGGRMAFITPSEFLNANYGVAHKAHLLQSGCWRYLITFDFRDDVFSDAMTTGCITLFERGSRPVDELTLVTARPDRLDAVLDLIQGRPHDPDALNVRSVGVEQLDPNRKWAQYLRNNDTSHHARLVPFTRFARAKRGIATGHNGYFTMSRENAAEANLPTDFFVSCLTKAAHASRLLLRSEDVEAMAAAGQKVGLLYLDGSERSSALDAYIAVGEEQGVHERYLTRTRNPWWSMERKDPPDIFATVFGREGLRFVRNEAKARSLACCHGIYVEDPEHVELVMAWLLTDFAQEAVAEERREYGAGLQKVEPNDINKSLIIDIDELTVAERSDVLKLYKRWRSAEIADNPQAAEAARADLDALFRAAAA